MPMRIVLGFVAYVANTGEGKPALLKGAQGQVYSVNDVGLTTPLACRSMATEEVIPNPTSNEDGYIGGFKVYISGTATGVIWVAGGYPIYQPFSNLIGPESVVPGPPGPPGPAGPAGPIGGSEFTGSAEPGTSFSTLAQGEEEIVNVIANPDFGLVSNVTPFSTPAPIKVASYNIRLSSISEANSENDWENRLTPCAQEIIDTNAPILGLQEVSFAGDDRSQALELVAEINRLNGNNKWVATYGVERGGSGAFIWDTTKVSKESDFTAYKLNNPDNNRAIMWGKFKVAGTDAVFLMANTHLQHNVPNLEIGRALRLEAIKIITKLIGDIETEEKCPVVIVGDFNFAGTDVSDPKGYLVFKGYKDTELEVADPENKLYSSFNGFKPMMEGRQDGTWIDGIFINSEVAVTAMGINMTYADGLKLPLKTPMPSDHQLMWAELKIESAPRVERPFSPRISTTAGGGATTYQTYRDGKPAIVVSSGTSDAASVYIGSSLEELGMEIGTTYTVSVDFDLDHVLSGAARDYARTILFSSTEGEYSEQAPNVVGKSRISMTYTPTKEDESLRLFHGHVGGKSYWSNLLVTEKPGYTEYFDGNSPNAWWGDKVVGINPSSIFPGNLTPEAAKSLADAIRPYISY